MLNYIAPGDEIHWGYTKVGMDTGWTLWQLFRSNARRKKSRRFTLVLTRINEIRFIIGLISRPPLYDTRSLHWIELTELASTGPQVWYGNLTL